MKKKINIEVDQEKLKELQLQKIDEHLQKLESDVVFMNSKQLILCSIRNQDFEQNIMRDRNSITLSSVNHHPDLPKRSAI